MTTSRAQKQSKDKNTHLRKVEDDVSQASVHADILHLQSTIGNQAVQRLLAEGRIQRDEATGIGSFAWKKHHLLSESESQLHLDPEIEAQMRAMQLLQSQLQFQTIGQSLKNIDLFNVTIPAEKSSLFDTPATAESKPLVPTGNGPDTAKPGSTSDIFDAVLAVPSVEQAVDRLKGEAESKVKRDWGRLSGGEKAGVISVTAIIGGTALGAALSNAESRKFLFEQVEGRDISVPGLSGLSVQLNLAGEEKSVHLTLDLTQFLPPSLK